MNSYFNTYPLPEPAPAHILGGTGYYMFRYNDFVKRFPGEKPPHYYKVYGDKYVKKFTEKLYNKLSPGGKEWMLRTKLELQLEMEHMLMQDPMIELRKKEFKKFAFESHATIYKRTGVLDLSLTDRVYILISLDLKDLFGEIGWQALKVGLYCHNYPLSFSSSLR